MNKRHLLLPLAVAAGLLSLSACKKEATPDAPLPGTAATQAQGGETADQFVARVNAEIKASYPELTSAQWLASTYINVDSQRVAATSNERSLAQLNRWIEQAKAYEGAPMSEESRRALSLLKLMTSMPAPRDPARLAELTTIAARMEGMYGEGTWCTGEGEARQCRQLGELEDVLRSSRDYDEQLQAWEGWHTISSPMRPDYVRFVELVNEGAREMGFADTGAMWRGGYDMPPDAFAAETDRLWDQVRPLYEQLHCYTRDRLAQTYGVERGQVAGGLLPAHLTGNMWQQDWGNLWDILEPYKGVGSLDISAGLQKQFQQDLGAALYRRGSNASVQQRFEAEREAQLQVARQMTERAQDFYTSLSMPKLPETYWARTQFIKPLDRNVVCHASAWDMNLGGEDGKSPDVRTKMCIKPNEEDFTTIYHELGHVYYYLAYNHQPALFQGGANDGFHEAIGDTIVLAMTPKYLESIGLVEGQSQSEQALINAQMRMALAKVAFLPFGLMIDRWRWGVFDGSITPDHYNQAWWELKAKYQGVAPPGARGEEFFDPGAKYHVPGNTPYTRYFLSHLLQFQFYKSLCEAAGHTGPLYDCTFYGNAEAGRKFWAMMQYGSSQPWQVTLKDLTGSEQLDGGAVLEYFAPLQDWLKKQNEGKSCGWQAAAPAAPAAPAPAPGGAPETPAKQG